jgi:hypothetical protein
MTIPVDTSSNYMRGIIFRDSHTMTLNFPELYSDPAFCGSEAFIFIYSEEEKEEGFLIADLVFFACDDNNLYLLDGKKYIAKIPYSSLQTFCPYTVSKREYFFPPANSPKRAMLIEIKFNNEKNLSRTLVLVFPDSALHAYELDFPSQKVHLQLMEANKTHNFITHEPTPSIINLGSQLNGHYIPNEINTEKCVIDYYIGI